MRDPRGRFVKQNTECPWDFGLVVFIMFVIFIFCFLYVRQGFEYKQQLNISDREQGHFLVEELKYRTKCQRAWTILHEDPRDGRKAYKVLDE